MTERDPFQELLDESRHREALAERARERSLEAQLREDALFAGTLRDLAEQADVVSLRTESGAAHHGRVAGVAVDHVIVLANDGTVIYVATDAVTDVRPEPGVRQGPATGGRDVAVDRTLAEVLARLGEDRPRVNLRVRGQRDPVAGALAGVGADVVSVRLDGGTTLSYVRVAAITEVLVIP